LYVSSPESFKIKISTIFNIVLSIGKAEAGLNIILVLTLYTYLIIDITSYYPYYTT